LKTYFELPHSIDESAIVLMYNLQTILKITNNILSMAI